MVKDFNHMKRMSTRKIRVNIGKKRHISPLKKNSFGLSLISNGVISYYKADHDFWYIVHSLIYYKFSPGSIQTL
jgi:hypothetical protein